MSQPGMTLTPAAAAAGLATGAGAGAGAGELPSAAATLPAGGLAARVAAHPRVILTLACLLALLPFLSKPLHIDDPMYVWAAEHILERPLDPYGFAVNWGVTLTPMAEEMKNPPLVCYYLAGAIALLGRSEQALHLAMLLPALGLILGTYQIAKELGGGGRPLVAAAATLATPVFLLSATTVMSDVAMVCAYVWAVYFWVRGIRSDRPGMLVVASLLIAVSTLTKYFGITLFPLLVAHGFMARRRPGAWLLPLLLPAAILTAFHFWTRGLYGHGMLLDAIGFAARERWSAGGPGGGSTLASTLTGLAFTGGCCAAVVFLSGAAAPRTFAVAAAVTMIATAALLLAFDPVKDHSVRHLGATRWWFVVQVSFWCACGCGMLAVLAAHVARSRTADDAMLGCWVAGTFCFAVFVNWNVAGRSILPMAPAAAILAARAWERRTERAGARGAWRPWAAVAPAAPLALLVCAADASLARTHRDAADQVMALVEASGDDGAGESGAGSVYFAGHWGFQHYMQQRGATALDRQRTRLEAGDVVVMPENNASVRFGPPPNTARLAATLELAPMRLVSTMRPDTDAGFYSNNWGPLPFAIGRVPAERYRVMVMEVAAGARRP